MNDLSCCNTGCNCNPNNMPNNKMCQLTKSAHNFNVEEIKKLTSNPKFICKCCGRTANSKEDLCSPTSLN